MREGTFRATTGAVAWRALHNFATNPALLVPSLIFPLFFFIAFAGGLSAVEDVPGFDFPSGYTAFQFVFVMLQSAAMGGVFTGLSVAADFESGFARRLLLAASDRRAVLLGYGLAALVRWLLTVSMITVIALLAGMHVDGSGVDLFGLLGLALLVNLAGFGWASGVALRARSIQAGPIMQMPTFLILFLAPVYVPLDLLTGWIDTVAALNPMTAILEAGRALISGDPSGVALAFAVVLALVALFALWSLRGLRSAERAAG